MPLIGGLYHTVGLDQMLSENTPVIGGFCHTADFDQLWSKKIGLPLVGGGLCHVSDFDQMWSKKFCPSLEVFVTTQTLTKCSPKNVPLIGGFFHVSDFNQIWSKKRFAPRQRTLSRLVLRPNVVQKCSPCRRTLSRLGLITKCGTKKMCPSLEDFVTSW